MTTEQDLLSPEFALLKGDLLLSVSEVGAAESWFQNAFDVAQRWGARMPLLEAAARLTRLRRPSMERPDGVDRLRGVYETFTEGFETRNLVEARALLNEV
jgi:hypothetical protein